MSQTLSKISTALLTTSKKVWEIYGPGYIRGIKVFSAVLGVVILIIGLIWITAVVACMLPMPLDLIWSFAMLVFFAAGLYAVMEKHL